MEKLAMTDDRPFRFFVCMRCLKECLAGETAGFELHRARADSGFGCRSCGEAMVELEPAFGIWLQRFCGLRVNELMGLEVAVQKAPPVLGRFGLTLSIKHGETHVEDVTRYARNDGELANLFESMREEKRRLEEVYALGWHEAV